MIIWKCCWNTSDFIPNRPNQFSNSNRLVDLDEHLLPWQAVWLSSNQCWRKCVPSQPGLQTHGVMLKANVSYVVLCALQKWNKNTNNFKTSSCGWVDRKRMTIGQHAMDGQEMGQALTFYSLGSVHLFPPCSGPWRWWLDSQVEETVEHLKKNNVFQWHHKTPKIPLGRFQLLPEFWDVFFDFVEETDQQNTKNL